MLRKCAVKKLEDEQETFKITDKEILEMLGHKKFTTDKLPSKDEIGTVNGLAWTSVGGELLPIEVAVMEGTGKLELTGSLGDVMQESAKAAVTCIRSHANSLGINPQFYKIKIFTFTLPRVLYQRTVLRRVLQWQPPFIQL